MISRRLLRFYSEDALVLTSSHKASVKVKLNKPKSLNALDIPMIGLLQKLVLEWNSSESTRLVIFSADGQKAFCAGGDVKSLYMARQEGNSSVFSKFFSKEYILDYSLARMRPVQMSVWDGMVLGGGLGISIHSPIRVATEKSMFSMPEALIGLYPDVAGTYFLPRLPGSIGLYLGITAARLNSEELVRAGAATHFVKGENLSKLKETLIENVTSESSLQQIENIVSEYSEPISGPLEDIENIEKYFGKAKNVEEIFERLQNGCEWGQKLLKSMAKLCPLSMKIAFEQVKRGRNLSLSEVFKLEYRISMNFMKGHDFFEGYRALLLDKDKDPKWQFKTLAEVSDDLVQSYFEAPSDHFVDLDVEAELVKLRKQ
jgi:enoyl-CoA hydratase/carnithine racemase